MTRLTPAQVQEMEEWITDPHRCNISEQVIIRFARLIASHRALEEEREQAIEAASDAHLGKVFKRAVKDNVERMESRISELTWELQQSQAEATRLRKLLDKLFNDCMASDFNEHWDSYKQVQQALTGQEAKDGR